MKVRFSPTIPNILTTIRLCAIPIMSWFIYVSAQEGFDHYRVIAFVIFITIWLTDVLDGFIARRFNQVSEFGKIFDPFVDKIFQFTTALMMLIVKRIPAWVVIFMLVKETVMILGGAYLLQKKSVVVHSKWYGKATTVLFVAALATMFFIPDSQMWVSSYVFIPPVLMAAFSVIAYGKMMFLDADPKKSVAGSVEVSGAESTVAAAEADSPTKSEDAVKGE